MEITELLKLLYSNKVTYVLQSFSKGYMDFQLFILILFHFYSKIILDAIFSSKQKKSCLAMSLLQLLFRSAIFFSFVVNTAQHSYLARSHCVSNLRTNPIIHNVKIKGTVPYPLKISEDSVSTLCKLLRNTNLNINQQLPESKFEVVNQNLS